MKITIEKWKPVKDYEDYYLVSNLGNIKSIKKRVKNGQGYRYIPSKILKPHKNKLGYMQVRLYKNGENKNCYIHRLVAEAFIPNPNEYKEINHIDENKHNNRIDNLEWCLKKYNLNYGTRNERISKNNINRPKCRFEKVVQYDLQGNFIKEYENLCIAEKETKIRHIRECCDNKRKTAGGYIFKYKNELLKKEGE